MALSREDLDHLCQKYTSRTEGSPEYKLLWAYIEQVAIITRFEEDMERLEEIVKERGQSGTINASAQLDDMRECMSGHQEYGWGAGSRL